MLGLSTPLSCAAMAWAALVVASFAIASRNPTTPAVPRLDRRTRIPSKLKVWNIRDEVKSDLWREPFKWSDLDGNKHFFGSLSQKESGLLHTEPMRYIVTTGKVTLVRPGKTPKRVQVGAIRYLPVYRDGNGNATWQIDVMVYIDQKGMPKPATVRNDEGRKIKGPLGVAGCMFSESVQSARHPEVANTLECFAIDFISRKGTPISHLFYQDLEEVGGFSDPKPRPLPLSKAKGKIRDRAWAVKALKMAIKALEERMLTSHLPMNDEGE